MFEVVVRRHGHDASEPDREGEATLSEGCLPGLQRDRDRERKKERVSECDRDRERI